MIARTRAELFLIAATAFVATVGARPYAGSWNDGSRLATVESLVDRGTLDKIFIDGRFYSDKPPVLSLALAGVYAGMKQMTGLDARREPGRFCRWMTLASSGLAYVVAVWSVLRFSAGVGAPPAARITIAAVFAFSTVAAAYSRQVNSHVVLLAVAAALLCALTDLAKESRAGAGRTRTLVACGFLAGLGYTLDALAGPLLLVATGALVAHRARTARGVALFGLGALPPVALHHVVLFGFAGTFSPANAVPEYFRWPGSPFDESSMTGVLRHSPVELVVYAAALLFGKRGFVLHDLPLLLVAPALASILRTPVRERAEIVAMLAWCTATWIGDALFSDNASGNCVSIRWFVPFLAPGFYVLAVWLRERPDALGQLFVLGALGAVLGASAWWMGPWYGRILPLYWPLAITGVLTVLAFWRADVGLGAASR